MSNLFYIIAEKLISGVVKVRDAVLKKFEAFIKKSFEFLQRVYGKYSQKKGCVFKGQTHGIAKKDGQYRAVSDIIYLKPILGEWIRTTVTKKVSEEEIDPRYRDIKDDEIIDDTKEIDENVLSF